MVWVMTIIFNLIFKICGGGCWVNPLMLHSKMFCCSGIEKKFYHNHVFGIISSFSLLQSSCYDSMLIKIAFSVRVWWQNGIPKITSCVHKYSFAGKILSQSSMNLSYFTKITFWSERLAEAREKVNYFTSQRFMILGNRLCSFTLFTAFHLVVKHQFHLLSYRLQPKPYLLFFSLFSDSFIVSTPYATIW